MALKDRSSFSGGRVAAPNLSGTMNALKNIQNQIQSAEDRKFKLNAAADTANFRQQQLDMQRQGLDIRADKAAADALYNNQILGIKQSAESRAANKFEQDNLLGEALTGLPSMYGKTNVTVPGTTGNAASRNQIIAENNTINNANSENLAAQEAAGVNYNKLYDKYSNQFTSNPSQMMTADGGAIPYQEVSVPGTSSKKYVTQTGEELAFDPKSALGKIAYGSGTYGTGKMQAFDLPPTKTYTPEKAHELALEESGLNQLKAVLPTKDVPKLIPSTKARTKSVNGRLSRSQWMEKARTSILSNDALNGSTKLKALDKLAAQANAVYGKPGSGGKKGLTFNQQWKIIKEKAKTQEKSNTMSDFYSMGVPKNIKTIKGAQSYINKKGKGSGSVSSALSKFSTDNWVEDDREEAFEASEEAASLGYTPKQISKALSLARESDGSFDNSLFRGSLK